MVESRHTRVIAVDGGGTRCRVALRDGHDVILVETGSANVSTDFEGGIHQVVDGINALAAKTDESADALAVVPAYVGLAGVTGPEIAARVREALPFAKVRVEDDRPAALCGALGDDEGVIAHCGTGSFYGARIAGKMTFSGGWGPVLGDEASAHWIGKMALRGALEAVDGRREATQLAQMLLDRFGGATGIVRFGRTALAPEFGALAPLVTELARAGDHLGRSVMNAGAAEIARSLPAIGWTSGMPICLTGGIGPHFEPYLPKPMQADIKPPAGSPVSGALSLAQELASVATA